MNNLQNEVTLDSLKLMVAEVSRLIDEDVPAALRLSEHCLSVADGMTDPIAKARAAVARAGVLTVDSQYTRALAYWDEALRIYEEAGDVLYAAKVRMNRVVTYMHLARYEDAYRDGELAHQVFLARNDKLRLAMNYFNLGHIDFRLDRLQEELAKLDKAEALLLELKDERNLAKAYLNRAVALTSLNLPDEASRYYELAIQLGSKNQMTRVVVSSRYNLGYLYYMQGQYTQALDILAETRNELTTDQWYIGLCDLTQSEIYLDLNMFREAARLAEAARIVFEFIEKPFEIAKAIAVTAIAAGRLGQFDQAVKLFARAGMMFREQGNSVRAAAIDLYRGIVCLQLDQYEEARLLAQAAYESFIKEDVKPRGAFSRIISARASLGLADLDSASKDASDAMRLHEASPAPWVSHQLYGLLGEIQLARGDLESARDTFRKAVEELEPVRANILFDELRMNYLKDKVALYEQLVTTNLTLGRPETVREAFETVERAKSRTLVELLASHTPLEPVTWSSIEDIQQTLSPDTVLLEYYMVRDEVMVFVATRSRFEVIRRICSRAALKERFDLLRFQFSRAQRSATPLLNIQDHLKELYRMLVLSVEPYLEDRRTLIFVPFDFLHYLPLHALFDGERYLTDRLAISYAPTANIYRLLKTREVQAEGKSLLIGVPDARTPFIEEEIESIRSVLPSAEVLLGPEATRESITREIEHMRVIHIASHASFRPDNAMFSSIRLHDSQLNFFDIYNLRTPASLVTLSGCGTGLSNVVGGDELLGLVRGFFYAGAKSVVVSLWEVNDQTTAELMKYFYGFLSRGVSKSESLRRAMLQIKQDYPHPYHWAPFLLMGDPK